MERLTRPCKNTENGKYIPYTVGTYTGIFPDCTLGKVVERLAKYEDLEFTPAEIAYLARFFKDKTSTEEIVSNMQTAAKLMEWAKWKDLEAEGKLVLLPCKEGDTIYKIVKFCGENTGCYEFYRPSVEFESDCEHFEPQYYWDDCERCNAEIEDDDKEPWYCSLNLDILCEKCKERFAIQKDKFTLSKIRQIFNTPMFNENTSLEDIFYLSLEDAESALKALKGESIWIQKQ